MAAARIDAHFEMLENLLHNLSFAISTEPADMDANDAVLQQAKSVLPDIIANIFVLTRDGTNIGNAVGQHAAAGDRDYFQNVMAGAPLAVGAPIRSRSNLGWVIPIARPVKDANGDIRAVLAVATFLSAFQELMGANNLPVGSVVRILDHAGREVMSVPGDGGPAEIDLPRLDDAIRLYRAGHDMRELEQKAGAAIGVAATHRAPWRIGVALPVDVSTVLAASF
jgi:hypothetical protein